MSGHRVMMIQQGARRNYIYARQLEAAGLLHSLATDVAWAAGRRGPLSTLLSRLAPRRKVTGIDPSRLKPSLLPNLASVAKLVMHEERAFPLIDEALALPLRLRGLVGADVVVSYLGNGGSFLDYAKRQGARIVTDFIITPKYLEIEAEERRRWVGWESSAASQSLIDFFRRRMSRLITISDLYLCPSQTVARDLAELTGFDPTRVRLVPYGSSGVLLRGSRPVRGRVLFAGAAGLRKGIPYLAEAARILRARDPEIAIVVAGAVTDTVRARPEARHLTFLGKLDRERMADEFARADVYCLPSLAEGSATSIFEALANGVPVVTTSSSGSVVEDGREGFIVFERSGEGIAEAIQCIVADRGLRKRMSEAARTTAARYSDAACGERFIAVIRNLLADCG